MPLLTKKQAAANLGELYGPEGKPFTGRTINRWMADTLPHFKVGHRAMFDADAITRWANLRFVRNPEQPRQP